MNIQKILSVGGPAVIVIVLAFSFLGMAGISPFSLSAQAVQKTGAIDTPINTNKPAESAQVIQLGYKNYNYYFPSTNSDTITIEKDKPVRFDLLLSGPYALQGCLKAVKMPQDLGGQLKVARQGDAFLDFTPQKAGDFVFSCSMGMGFGKIRVQA